MVPTLDTTRPEHSIGERLAVVRTRLLEESGLLLWQKANARFPEWSVPELRLSYQGKMSQGLTVSRGGLTSRMLRSIAVLGPKHPVIFSRVRHSQIPRLPRLARSLFPLWRRLWCRFWGWFGRRLWRGSCLWSRSCNRRRRLWLYNRLLRSLLCSLKNVLCR
jgi:hypothetical protein